LIPSILDFASEAQQIETKCHLQGLFENEKENYQTFITNSLTQSTSQSKPSTKTKTLVARLSKTKVAVINEVEEYIRLQEISLGSNPHTW
ncbi:4896_t:CDS:1, partial [Funneliformis caledonium]